ncbi:hypothetical protein [Paenibacillus sp. YIM B09110]|uniref:hypothetical protein n=1 Tax=Paenibacillus sp. YIM B09110 TaxID=3126102 RepID=UPI003FA6BB9E
MDQRYRSRGMRVFDPTVFENVKVALENHFYDLDNLDRLIDIVGRNDRMEMAVMAREFGLRFTLAGQSGMSAEVRLASSLRQLAAELLNQDGDAAATGAGCSLSLRFRVVISEPADQCRKIEGIMRTIWGDDMPFTQTISYVHGQDSPPEAVFYTNKIELKFNRTIGEEQMEDIPELAEHMLQTLRELKAAAI